MENQNDKRNKRSKDLVKLYFVLGCIIVLLLPFLILLNPHKPWPFVIGLSSAVLIPVMVIITIRLIMEIYPEENIQDFSTDTKAASEKQTRHLPRNFYFFFLLIFWLISFFVIVLAIRLLWPLTGSQDGTFTERKKKPGKDGQIDITLLQLNDVYEISPIDNGHVGGMARVATLHRQLLNANPNTYTLLAGDFFSPSAIGTAKTPDNKRIMGRQMTEVLNSVGLDLVTFGNHEFDIDETEVKDLINASNFSWVSSNVKNIINSTSNDFTKKEDNAAIPIPSTRIVPFCDEDGTCITIGVIGITINSTVTNYVLYDDYYKAAKEAIAQLEGKCDFIIAVTHLPLEDDKKLAHQFPQIKLIIGGHEHKASDTRIANTMIMKADANARTVYIHQLHYDVNKETLGIKSDLKPIDPSIPEDSLTQLSVDKWNNIADNYWRTKENFSPCDILVPKLDSPYNGTEDAVRYTSSNLTRMIAAAFKDGIPEKNDAVLYNSGSIRIDDYIRDRVTEYDIIRVLPYPGKLKLARMRGSLIDSLLTISESKPGNGCFLQYDDRITKGKNSKWLIGGNPLDNNHTYNIIVNDYLVSGRQEFMKFLNPETGLLKVDTFAKSYDVRKKVIAYLSKNNPPVKNPGVKVPCN